MLTASLPNKCSWNGSIRFTAIYVCMRACMWFQYRKWKISPLLHVMRLNISKSASLGITRTDDIQLIEQCRHTCHIHF